MKGSSTIKTSFPGAALSTDPFEEEELDPEPEERLAVTQRPGLKTVPFGSTLSPRPLRVRYDDNGKVLLTTGVGTSILLSQLPEWEQRELFRHLRFAADVGTL